MASARTPGVLCRTRLLQDVDSGTLCMQSSPLPGPVKGISSYPEMYQPGFMAAALGADQAITEDDREEFALVRKMPVVNSKGQPYRSVNHYVSDRTLYFGPPAVYREFAADSDDELANTKWVGKKRTRWLKAMLEFDKARDADKQVIFYRWVRKAYKRKYGDDVNVPELIARGMSQELADKLTEIRGSVRLKKIHDEQFHAGGFNPRPIKHTTSSGGKVYLFGTLSDHATGMAVDIDDGENAQLPLKAWHFVEKLTGKQVLRTGRWSSETAAEGLWKDIKQLNDLFVEKCASEVKRVEKERADKAEREKAAKDKSGNPAPQNPPVAPAAAGQHSKHAPEKHEHKARTPLEEILGDQYKTLAPWVTKGFFHLPVELVLEMQSHGFTWGATFANSDVDLHHFEID